MGDRQQAAFRAMMELRNAQSSIEECLAAMQHDTAKYGEWQANHGQWMAEARERYGEALANFDRCTADPNGI